MFPTLSELTRMNLIKLNLCRLYPLIFSERNYLLFSGNLALKVF